MFSSVAIILHYRVPGEKPFLGRGRNNLGGAGKQCPHDIISDILI
jgi:hypothetical protein